jgi:hypothetical protein
MPQAPERRMVTRGKPPLVGLFRRGEGGDLEPQLFGDGSVWVEQ